MEMRKILKIGGYVAAAVAAAASTVMTVQDIKQSKAATNTQMEETIPEPPEVVE